MMSELMGLGLVYRFLDRWILSSEASDREENAVSEVVEPEPVLNEEYRYHECEAHWLCSNYEMQMRWPTWPGMMYGRYR